MAVISMKVWNESAAPLRFHFEPYGDMFEIPPGAEVWLHAELTATGDDVTFTVGYDGALLTVYAPGAPNHLLDAFVTLDGIRLEPD